MPSDTHLSRQDTSIAHPSSASQSDLAAKHGVFADFASVANLDEVVDLGPATDARFADGGAVHDALGLNLNIVFDHRGTRLANFVPASINLARKPVAVTSNHDSVLQENTISDARAFAHADMGMGEKIVANFYPAINSHEAMQHGVRTDLHAFINKTIRTDVSSYSNSCGFRDNSGWMNTRRVRRCLMEEFYRPFEIQLRICRNQHGDLRGVYILGHNDGGRLSGCQRGAIFAVGKECQFARFRILDSSHAGDFDIRVTVKFAAQTPGDLAKFHDGFSCDLSRQSKCITTRAVEAKW